MSQTRSWMAVPALAAGVLLLAGAPAFAADTATIYDVSQEGLTPAEGQKLADSFGIPNSVSDNGAFTYTGKSFGAVPHKQVSSGKDESGRPTVSNALDIPALESIRPPPCRRAGGSTRARGCRARRRPSGGPIRPCRWRPACAGRHRTTCPCR